MKKYLKVVVVAGFVAMAAAAIGTSSQTYAAAATVTWSGNACVATTPDCKFSNTNNWVGGVVPEDGDVIVFDTTNGKYNTTTTVASNPINDLANVAFSGVKTIVPTAALPSSVYAYIDNITLKSGATFDFKTGSNFNTRITTLNAQGDVTFDVSKTIVTNIGEIKGNLTYTTSAASTTVTLPYTANVTGTVIVGKNVALILGFNRVCTTTTCTQQWPEVKDYDVSGTLDIRGSYITKTESGITVNYPITPWDIALPITLNEGALLSITSTYATKDRPVDATLSALTINGNAQIRVGSYITVDATKATIKSGSVKQDYGAAGGTLKLASSSGDQNNNQAQTPAPAPAAPANNTPAPAATSKGIGVPSTGGLSLNNPVVIILAGIAVAAVVFCGRKFAHHRKSAAKR